MSKPTEHNFIVTREYRRFAEFCDACQHYRYIGLCYGPPGVGKTLSALHYSNWEQVEAYHSAANSGALLDSVLGSTTVFYTPNVLNGPGHVARDIASLRRRLLSICWGALFREEEGLLTEARKRANEYWQTVLSDVLASPQEPEPTLQQISREFSAKRDAVPDPTRLILVDEADRLKMPSLEQIRAIFDEGGLGLILLGMPGLEKRLARYPQLYSRVGFVHEFRPLHTDEVRMLLQQQWKPHEVCRALTGIAEETVLAAIVRITGGNFRLLHRLLTQVARVLEINDLQTVTIEVVDAARESLVIGTH